MEGINQIVSIASTVHGIESSSKIGRNDSRQERKRIQVPIPRVFLKYNKSMDKTEPNGWQCSKIQNWNSWEEIVVVALYVLVSTMYGS